MINCVVGGMVSMLISLTPWASLIYVECMKSIAGVFSAVPLSYRHLRYTSPARNTSS